MGWLSETELKVLERNKAVWTGVKSVHRSELGSSLQLCVCHRHPEKPAATDVKDRVQGNVASKLHEERSGFLNPSPVPPAGPPPAPAPLRAQPADADCWSASREFVPAQVPIPAATGPSAHRSSSAQGLAQPAPPAAPPPTSTPNPSPCLHASPHGGVPQDSQPGSRSTNRDRNRNGYTRDLRASCSRGDRRRVPRLASTIALRDGSLILSEGPAIPEVTREFARERPKGASTTNRATGTSASTQSPRRPTPALIPT